MIDADDKWTTYIYDSGGRLVRFEDQKGQATTYGYDILGRLVWERNPLGEQVSYEYDDGSGCSSCGGGGGRLKAVTDAAGRRTSLRVGGGR